MKSLRKGQMSDSVMLAVVLTLAGGLQDAYSYNCRGHVFANAQTGNVVLLGQNLAMGEWKSAVRYLMPLLAFVGGVYVAELIHYRCKQSQRLHWRQIVLMTELLFLILAGLMPEQWDMFANMLLSFSCAMQVNAFRKFRGMPSATTMCIGNMRSATELLCRYHITGNAKEKQASIYYYSIIGIFALGAAVGSILCRVMGRHTIWVAAGLMLVGFVMMFIKEDA
jgi:uncharacterized membrane protein YoaK (UPF0700 family)